MSIASEIQALQQDKSDIATAISNKGVTVPSGSGFDSFAGLINDIPSGGSNIQTGTFTVASDSDNYWITYPSDKIVAFAEITANQDDLDALADKTGYGVYNSLSCNDKMVQTIIPVYNIKLTRYNEGAYYRDNTTLAHFSINNGGYSNKQMYDGAEQGNFKCGLGNYQLKAGIRYTYNLYFKE